MSVSKEEKKPNLEDAAEMLWVVLANVSQGDWTKQTEEWQETAAKWRDYYFKAIRKETYKLGEFVFTKNSLGYFTTPEITGWFDEQKREIEFSEAQLIKMGAKKET